MLWNSVDQLDSKSNLVLLSLKWRKSIWVYRRELSRVSPAWDKHGIMNTRRAHRMGQAVAGGVDSVTGGADRRRLILVKVAEPCRRRSAKAMCEPILSCRFQTQRRVPAEAMCQTILSRFRTQRRSLRRPRASCIFRQEPN